MATLLLSDRDRTTATVVYGAPGAPAPGAVSPTPVSVQSDLNVIYNDTSSPYNGYRAVSRWVGPLAPGTPTNWSATYGNLRQPTIDLVSEYSGPGTGGAQIILGFTQATPGNPAPLNPENFWWANNSRNQSSGQSPQLGIMMSNSQSNHMLVSPGFSVLSYSPTVIPLKAQTASPGGGVAVQGISSATPSTGAGVFHANIGSPAFSGGTQYFLTMYAGSNAVGQISTPGTSVSYLSASDYRLKDEVTPIENGLSLIDSLQPRLWKWRETEEPGIGFIAHEVQEVFPESEKLGLVTGEKDKTVSYGKLVDDNGVAKQTFNQTTNENEDEIIAQPSEQELSDYANTGYTWVQTEERANYQGIDTSFLIAPLVASVKELKAMIEAHEVRISALEA
jgi:hypothetical protein